MLRGLGVGVSWGWNWGANGERVRGRVWDYKEGEGGSTVFEFNGDGFVGAFHEESRYWMSRVSWEGLIKSLEGCSSACCRLKRG